MCVGSQSTYFFRSLVREIIPLVNLNKINLITDRLDLEADSPKFLIFLGDNEQKHANHLKQYELVTKLDLRTPPIRWFELLRSHLTYLDWSMLDIEIYRKK